MTQRKRIGRKHRRNLYGRDGRQCQCCHITVFSTTADETLRASVHHITPVSEGGKNDQRNLILLCVGCHRDLHQGRIRIVGTDAFDVRFQRVLAATE